MSHNDKALYEFSDFRLDIPERLLLRKGKPVSLSEKAFQTLCVLVEQSGHLVTKDDLMSKVWPDTIVEENNLDKSVSTLRQALGERKGRGKFIETVRGHGYRFVAEVRCIQSDHVTLEQKPKSPEATGVDFPSHAIGKQKTALIAVALLVVVVASTLFVILKKNALQHPSAGTSTIQSVAVLPFTNLSKDKDQDYFADGLSEEILNALSKNPKLRVVARTSAFSFKGEDADLRVIGQKLNIANILQGSVQKEGKQLRITARLIRTTDGIQLWSETYDREMKDVFRIQSDVATQIASALKAKFSPAGKIRIEKNPTVNITAYDYYLKGREYYFRRRKDDNERSIELFKKALEIDPSYALAYTGLADAYHKKFYLFGFPETWVDESIKTSQMAIGIDPNLSEAYVVLGKGYQIKRENTKFLEAIRKALALNPNSSESAGMYSVYLSETGKLDEALEWGTKVIALDPTSSWPYYNIASIYFDLNDIPQSESWLKKSLELQPDFTFAFGGLSTIRMIQSNIAEAREFAKKAIAIDPSTGNLSLIGRVELYSGNYEKAEEWYRKANLPVAAEWSKGWTEYSFTLIKLRQEKEAKPILERSKKIIQNLEAPNGDDHYCLALISAIEGNKSEAYMWLQKSIDAGYLSYAPMMRDPLLENIRDDARFREMMKNLEIRLAEMRKKAAIRESGLK